MTVNKYLILIFIFLSLTIKSNAQDSLFTSNWENGNKKEEGSFITDLKEGTWNKWNEKGELIETERYTEGNLNDKTKYEYYEHTLNLLFERKIWNEKGTLILLAEYSYRNNEKYNLTNFNEDGIKLSKGKVEYEKKEGKWEYYNDNGSVLKVIKFKNDIDFEKEELIEKEKNKFIGIKPTKENAIIKVYRKKSAMGILLSYPLLMNNSFVNEIENGTFFEIELTEDEIVEFSAKTEVERFVKLDVKMGRTYYLKCEIKMGAVMGRPKLKIVEPYIGEKEFNHLINSK